MGMNHYKLAPTFLYHSDFPSRLFPTQEEVDDAWENGWFGPPWLVGGDPLLSEAKFESKAKLIMAIRMDSRYKGILVGVRMNLQDLHNTLEEWERENLISKPKENQPEDD